MKSLHLVIASLTLAAVAGFGVAVSAGADPIPAVPGPYLVASDSVTVAQNIVMAMLGDGSITPAQTQDVALKCKALRVEIAKGQANPSDQQLTKVAAMVDALQITISELAHQPH